MSDLLDSLRGLDALEGSSEAELEQLASVAEQVNFAEGEVIFRENTPADELFLITDGNVSLEICAPSVGCRRILTVGTGELLGWSPVLEHSCYTATARSLTPTSAVRINGRQVLTLCEHDSQFGYHFMRRAAVALAKRLTATRLQLLDVFGSEMPPAVADTGNLQERGVS